VELIRLTNDAYQLRGGSNAGLIVRDKAAVIIDTGLDKDTAKRILRHVEALKVEIRAIVVTHAHADHFGGAATLRTRLHAPVFAPSLEAAVIENPILEPIYLYSGAMPPAELRHKFTLAEACPVDSLLSPGDVLIGSVPLHVIPAPGHSPNQMIVGGGDACFVTDAVFAPEVLDKHAIPFFVDIDQWQATLAGLPGLDGRYAAFVPGHGPAVSEVSLWASVNAERLDAIRAGVEWAVRTSADGELSDIVHLTIAHLDVHVPGPVIYWLTQTSILACLASLQRAGALSLEVTDNRLAWRARAASA
jgi:glyoxylase-like metal-dependent hydrolase (beta-lactamase superfamily II)